jgi:hypothetical protein
MAFALVWGLGIRLAHASPFALRPARLASEFSPGTVAQPRAKPDPVAAGSSEPGETKTAKPGDDEPEDAAVVEPKLLRKRGVPPFWIDREYDTHRTRAIALPPLFVHRTPTADHPEKLLHADLSLTFGWYAKKAKKRRWISPAALYFGSFSDHKTVWGAVPLLMGYKRVGEQFRFGQFPLFWWWGNKHVKNFFVLPLHYQQKSPDGFRGVSALLFWYGHKNLDDADVLNDRRHFVAAPVFWRFGRGLKQFDMSLLHTAGYNKLKGIRHQTVVPLYHWESLEFGNRKELWTALWVRRTDRARRRSAWAVPPLLTFSSRDPDRSLLSVTPLFWRGRNHLKGSVSTVVGPVGVYRDPLQSNNFVAPLWWQFTDRRHDTTLSMLLPLAIAHRNPQRTAVWTPLASGMRSKGGGWGFGIHPVLTFAGRRDNGASYQGILGAFWHVRDPTAYGGRGSDHLVLGPLAFRSRRGDRVDFGVPPLLTFAGKRGTKRYQVITPLFWHARDRDPDDPRHTVVFAPLYIHRNATGLHGGLPPLIFAGSDAHRRYAVFPPLLSAHVTNEDTGTRQTFTPLFVHSSGNDHRTVGVLALFWDVDRISERHTMLFPAFYRRRMGDRIQYITPLGGGLRHGARRVGVVGPIYWTRDRDRSGRGVLPLFFHDSRQVEGKRAQHTALVPLYLRRRTAGDDLDMWTPLVWRSHVRGDKPRRGLAVAPFYFRQRQPGGVDVDAGLGFFWSRDRRRHTHTIIAGPAFHRLSRKQIHTGVAPLYWWMDSEDKRRLIALPAVVHMENKAVGSHTTVAMPLWFDRLQANGRRTWAAFPFVFGGKRQYNFTRFSLVPPGYVDRFRLGRNYRFTGFVPLWFRYQKCGFKADDDPACAYELHGSFPLFLAGRDGRGRRTHGALGLYYFDRKPDGWRFYTLPFGLRHEPKKTLAWYFFPLYVKTTQTHNRVFLLPLYFRKAHRLEDESTTVIAPPLYIGQHKRDQRWFEAGLLVWQFRQQHKVSTAIVPPVFFHGHAYAERRLMWVLPLFLRDNHMARDTAWTTIFPALYVQRRKGENLDLVQFPLVWHIERGENQGTFGAFVWWDIRRKGKTTQLVPGLFARHATPSRDTKVIGPGLAWWIRGQGKDEGDLHWRALFGIFGGGREKDVRYVALFGAKIPVRGGRERRAQPGERPAKKTAKRKRRRRGRRGYAIDSNRRDHAPRASARVTSSQLPGFHRPIWSLGFPSITPITARINAPWATTRVFLPSSTRAR